MFDSEKFYAYLKGAKVIVHTDHAALLWMVLQILLDHKLYAKFSKWEF